MLTSNLALAALAVALSACAGIDTINGVRLNATRAPESSYCDRNPTVCVLFGAAFVGGLGAIFAANVAHHCSQPDKVCNGSGVPGGGQAACGPPV